MASPLALHSATDPKVIIKLLREHHTDVSARDSNGDTPVHALVRRPSGANKFQCLLGLLSYCDSGDLQIDSATSDGNTALHLAVKANDKLSVTVLLAFGADINSLNAQNRSPLDVTSDDEMIAFLVPLGAQSGVRVIECRSYKSIGKVPLKQKAEEDGESTVTDGNEGKMTLKLNDYHEGTLRTDLKDASEAVVNASLCDETVAAMLQLRELNLSMSSAPLPFSVCGGGERILCLDGGGIKGLIQIEVLMQIEKLTGRKISELFDWIVGTSTGGIIALAMVYAKKTLPELRQLYFELKEEVFSTSNKWGYDCNSQKLEELLKKSIGEKLVLTDVLQPKVLITAVDCRDTNLKLRFFNNCFFDEFSDDLVWKVARYTSAAPCFFDPCDQFVDGGVRANNPTDYALTVIQRFLDQQAEASQSPMPKYACVVSVGCGVYPPEKLGDFNVLQNLVFGKEWLNPVKKVKKTLADFQNLMRLLTAAITESEGVADNCRSRCEKQRIPFYRFSPLLDEIIKLSETDDEKLCGIILKAKAFLQAHETNMDELVQLFHHT